MYSFIKVIVERHTSYDALYGIRLLIAISAILSIRLLNQATEIALAAEIGSNKLIPLDSTGRFEMRGSIGSHEPCNSNGSQWMLQARQGEASPKCEKIDATLCFYLANEKAGHLTWRRPRGWSRTCLKKRQKIMAAASSGAILDAVLPRARRNYRMNIKHSQWKRG